MQMPDKKSVIDQAKRIAIDTGKVVGAITVVGGFIYAIGNSSAQDYIENVVNNMELVSRSETTFSNARIERLEASDREAKRNLTQLAIDGGKQTTEIENIKRSQEETARDIKTILRTLGRDPDGP